MTTTTLQEQWGHRTRTLRLGLGLSLRALSRLTDVDHGQLSKFENGLIGLGDESRMRIAAAFGCRVEEIFSYPDTTTEEGACPSAASATDGDSSPTPATKGATRSSAPSAPEPAESAPKGGPAREGGA